MKTKNTSNRSKSGCCLGILTHGLLGIVILVIALGAVGYGVEHYAAPRDLQRYPPPGQMIEVNNHKMHLYCTGTGTSTVILEAQANSSSFDWGFVQPEIAQLTRVCSYDRAGFGWSELDTQPRPAQAAADELYQLLNKAGEQGPYILVGASYGGHIVRLFAHDHADEVGGVILVDARPEKLFTIPDMQKQAKTGLGISRVIAFLGEFGLSRVFIAAAPDKIMPPAAVPLYKAHPGSYQIIFSSRLWHASYAEALAIDLSDAQVAAVGSLGDLPLIVIRHGKPMFGALPTLSAEEIEQKWQAFQEEMAKQSTAGRLMVAEDSGHSVQLDQPSIIVEAVQQMMANP